MTTYLAPGPLFLACGLAVAGLTACSSGPEIPTSMAQTQPPMQEAPNVAGTMVWKKPGINPAQYTSFIIDPVKIYQGQDANFGGADEADKQAMAEYTDREFRRALGERYRLTNAPSRNTARLQMTLVGMTSNIPVVATASRIAPVGIVTNVARSAAGAPPSFTGTVTLEGQFFDSESGQPIATFITTRAPRAIDIGATLTSTDAHEAAITSVADDLRDSLGKQTAAMPSSK